MGQITPSRRSERDKPFIMNRMETRFQGRCKILDEDRRTGDGLRFMRLIYKPGGIQEDVVAIRSFWYASQRNLPPMVDLILAMHLGRH